MKRDNELQGVDWARAPSWPLVAWRIISTIITAFVLWLAIAIPLLSAARAAAPCPALLSPDMVPGMCGLRFGMLAPFEGILMTEPEARKLEVALSLLTQREAELKFERGVRDGAEDRFNRDLEICQGKVDACSANLRESAGLELPAVPWYETKTFAVVATAVIVGVVVGGAMALAYELDSP